MDRQVALNNFLIANKLAASCANSVRQGCIQSFDLEIDHSFKIAKLRSLSNELMLATRAISLPNINLDLGNGLVRLEMLVQKPATTSVLDNLRSLSVSSSLPVHLGMGFKGNNITLEVSKNPHLLIGGTTGSGKSTVLHNLIANILVGSQAYLYIVDTKAIEFSRYQKLTKRAKTITSYSDYILLLQYLIDLMENRYQFLQKDGNFNDLSSIVLVIDEFADLAMQDQDGSGARLLCRLLQKCRAAGIYAVVATQRPSADIITGAIKANIPARIACRVASKVDSRVILDASGAETLTEIGEAIINNYEFSMERFKFSYSTPQEIYNYLLERSI